MYWIFGCWKRVGLPTQTHHSQWNRITLLKEDRLLREEKENSYCTLNLHHIRLGNFKNLLLHTTTPCFTNFFHK